CARWEDYGYDWFAYW
nr:immunoglobulin heavy chain junction region [Mus musculus]